MSVSRLSLRDLEYAVAVAEERHFGRAASRCHVSQPALSAQVKKLEALLGAKLFERTPRGVIVTEPGKLLIGQARRMLAEGRHFLEIASASGTLSGELIIDAIATLGPYIVPHILRPLRARFPSVDFVLREGQTGPILAALSAGETDLALISTPIPDEGLTVVPLFEEPFVAIHPADMVLADHSPITIDDLDGAHVLLLEEGHCLRDQALTLCARTDTKTHRHATSLETLRHLVAAGAGCSLLPACHRKRRNIRRPHPLHSNRRPARVSNDRADLPRKRSPCDALPRDRGDDQRGDARDRSATPRDGRRSGDEGGQAMTTDYFRMFAAYNAWANRRLYDAAAALPDADYRTERDAFFGSLHGTLNHILVGDRIWMRRFTGEGPTYTDLDHRPCADLPTLRREREAEDKRITAYIESLDDERLSGTITYRTVVRPVDITQKLMPALAHFFNHQTHHRGQAHALVTQIAGRDAMPSLDLIMFQRETGIGLS